MHIVDTEIVTATLHGGETGLRVVFNGEGGELWPSKWRLSTG